MEGKGSCSYNKASEKQQKNQTYCLTILDSQNKKDNLIS